MKIFHNSRSAFGILTPILLATAISMPKSAQSQQIPDRAPANAYPEEVTSRFINSCVTSATQTELPEAMAQSACQCMIWQFQDRYSLEDFATLPQRVSEDEATSREFLGIVSSCSPQPNS
ncbi:MAG: hypothetical protein AAGA60_23745 [Cyanobacteria bacterium P01_E01_bin.42]